MGRVAAPYGVHGWVKVLPLSDDPASLLEYRHGGCASSARRRRGSRSRSIDAKRAWRRDRRAASRRSTTREAAGALRGAEIGVPREALPAPRANEYYWADLVGLGGRESRRRRAWRRSLDVADNGAHPILRVAADEGARAADSVRRAVCRSRRRRGAADRRRLAVGLLSRRCGRTGNRMRIDVVTLFPEMVDAGGGVRRHRAGARARAVAAAACGIRAISRRMSTGPSTTGRTAADPGW